MTIAFWVLLVLLIAKSIWNVGCGVVLGIRGHRRDASSISMLLFVDGLLAVALVTLAAAREAPFRPWETAAIVTSAFIGSLVCMVLAVSVTRWYL